MFLFTYSIYYIFTTFVVFFWTALYFASVATLSAIVGQYVVGKVIKILGRASLIIFILSSMIFISAITLGLCNYFITLIFRSWLGKVSFYFLETNNHWVFPWSWTGGVGIAKTLDKIHHKEYMGFENICKYQW